MRFKAFTQKPRYGFCEPACWCFAFFLLCMVGLLLSGKTWWMVLLIFSGLFYLVVGVGAWQEKRWAAIVGIWFFVLFFVLRTLSVIAAERTSGLWFAVLSLWLAWRFWKALRRRDRETIEYVLGENTEESENAEFEVMRARMGEQPFSRVVTENPSVTIVPPDSPRLIEGVHHARKHWSKFTEAFSSRKPGDHFFVKTPITVGQSTEFIWFEIENVSRSRLFGRLANEPGGLEGLHLGSEVDVSIENVYDWYYSRGGRDLVGLFTDEAVLEAQICTAVV